MNDSRLGDQTIRLVSLAFEADVIKKEGNYWFFGTVTVTEVVAVLPEASVAE